MASPGRRLYLLLCLAFLIPASPLGAQEMLEGDPEQAVRIGRLTYCDSTGTLLRIREFTYEPDSIADGAWVRETVSDTTGPVAVFLNRYEGAKLIQKEEYDGEGHFLKKTQYSFVTLDGESYPAEETVEVFQPTPHLYSHTIAYSDQDGYHYPLEITRWQSGGQVERTTYTYPFCAGPAFRPTADSLLARAMPWAILTISHWRDTVRTDSTVVVYDRFPGTDTSYLRPAAIVRITNRGNPDTCVRYMAYDSLGRQPLQVHDRRGLHLRATDPQQLVWTAPDPAAERRGVLRAYDYCAADPELRVDPEEGENYLFDETGCFLSRVQATRSKQRLFLWLGYGTPPLSARFADPAHDPATIGMHTQVRLVTPEEIRTSLEEVGAFSAGHHGFFKGSAYMYRNSGYGGLLDFAVNGQHDIIDQVFYITRTLPEGYVAHNHYNYGNFLWGATACELGIPLFWSRLGAHFNNFFLSPDTKGSFDAMDDQYSIRTGYHWH